MENAATGLGHGVMDRFGDIQAFVRVVEAGSISRAADQLNIAKSAISRRLRELEARLGVELLQRAPRAITVTDAGHAYYRRCVTILADLDEADAAVGAAHAELSGTLRLAVPVSFGRRHLAGPLLSFAQAHPHIRFEIDFNDRPVDLIADNVDLALRIGRMSDSDLIVRRLTRIRHCIAASPDWWAAHGLPQHPEDLKAHCSLRYLHAPGQEIWQYKAPQGRIGTVAVPVRLRAGNGDFLCDAAAAGLGVVMGPTFIVHHPIAQGRLVPALTDYSWSNVHLWAVYPPTRHLAPRIRALIDHLVAAFSGIPPWDRAMPALVAAQP